MDILFLQGGNAGAYDEDTKLAASLQKALGSSYTVHYPRMPNEGAPEYASWGPKIAEELAALDGAVMLVGHSVGAALLFQYVAEVKPDVAGLFLLAPPYWDAVDELVPNLPRKLPLFLPGGAVDDGWVRLRGVDHRCSFFRIHFIPRFCRQTPNPCG